MTSFDESLSLSSSRTWQGPGWSAVQNLRSVLISIQSLMNATPYRNEPGFDKEVSGRMDGWMVGWLVGGMREREDFVREFTVFSKFVCVCVHMHVFELVRMCVVVGLIHTS